MTADASNRAVNRTASRAELKVDVLHARRELAETLDAIEDKLNVPRKVRRAADRTGERVRTLAKENPLLLGGIALGAAVVVGGAVWAIAKALSRD